MSTVAIGIVCKTPSAGHSKTRLSPPLEPQECAELSACFIRDMSRTVDALARRGDVTGYAIYSPVGSEHSLRPLLPVGFGLLPQIEAELGRRLIRATSELLAAGHRAVILVGADSPTLPLSILAAAIDALATGDAVVLSPALDGGYTLIGASRCHPRLFEDIPWSTGAVCRRTIERAGELGLAVVQVPAWYDVDDEASLGLLDHELSGRAAAFVAGAEAAATRAFLASRRARMDVASPARHVAGSGSRVTLR